MIGGVSVVNNQEIEDPYFDKRNYRKTTYRDTDQAGAQI